MKSGHSFSGLLAAFVLTALCLPGTASSGTRDMPMAGPPGGFPPMMAPGGIDRMGEMMGMCLDHAEKIGLTEEQVAKMKPLHREMQKKQARFTADLKIAELEFQEIMEPRDFDLEKAGAAARKIAGLKTDHHLEMLKAMKEIRAGLTDGQFARMRKLMPMMAGGKDTR